HVRSDGGDSGDLLPLQLRRDRGMCEVVSARAAAAPLGIGDRDEIDPLERAEELPRLLADALTVRQVAGVLIHDAEAPPESPPSVRRGDDLARISYTSRDRARGVFQSVAGQELAIRAHVRAASRRGR